VIACGCALRFYRIYGDFKVSLETLGGGQAAMGGYWYIQSYTFYGDMPCKPDSAAALKALKVGARLGKSGGFQEL